MLDAVDGVSRRVKWSSVRSGNISTSPRICCASPRISIALDVTCVILLTPVNPFARKDATSVVKDPLTPESGPSSSVVTRKQFIDLKTTKMRDSNAVQVSLSPLRPDDAYAK